MPATTSRHFARAFALATALALASPALADAPAVAAGDTLLTLGAEGKVSHAPDMATVSAGVATAGATAAAAMAANADAMARTVAALRRAGVADRDIQTASLNLAPVFAQAANGDESPPRITGYRAGNTVSVRLRDVARVGAAIDALVAAGANEINGPEFAMADPAPLLDAARTAAIATARARADLYARAAGLHVVRILSIAEDSAEGAPQNRFGFMEAMRKAPTPVAAGELDLTARVSVAFELAP